MQLTFSLSNILSKIDELDRLSDAQVVELAIMKDEYFEYLIYRYQGFLKSIVLSLASSRDEAEELFQESLWKLYNSLGTYRSEYPFKPWLRKIVLTTFLSMKRKERKTLSIEELSDKGLELSLTESSEEDMEMESALREALSKLPKDTRAIIYLRFKEGLTHEEIAKELGMSVESVRKRFSRAIKTLKEVMSD
ncbi:MAG: sigma-70 family RNA polymerase sigma factor [Synergistetes bacterium]|nr:sigma-70 family RNA polymerase sigma factor [Synergistota bacterium]MCX8127282.1 sigma-70 family RNA polymerase sigma factor [Synergistota bacterium]MDW8191832.1 sigma-70 family RNA polymerase sigma factor [Synergistota bacterium]